MSHAAMIATSLHELVDHLEGKPATRALLRAQVGRPREYFGDTLVSVTGAGSGIGRETALAFAREGAELVISDIDEASVKETAAQITARGGVAHAYPLDVADADAVEQFAEQVSSEHGVPDIVVNNAGVDWIGAFHEEPDEVSRRELEVNLLGTIYGTRLAVQRMLPRGRGHIVNVASGVGRVPLPGSAVYSATKHGIVGLTESLRLEYQGSGLRFSLIQPSQVETAMLAGQGRPKLLPVVTPDDVAAAVVRAVSDNRFEVWVPASQGVTAKLGGLLPRPAREWVLRTIGVGKIAGDTDAAARRGYHERMFGRH
jgi:NAD(P)-dependent dehydrogenase (short-subunit alcohol dehydrogenase family)